MDEPYCSTTPAGRKLFKGGVGVGFLASADFVLVAGWVAGVGGQTRAHAPDGHGHRALVAYRTPKQPRGTRHA